MDIDDINIFEKLSTGTFALLSGVLMIATLTFFIYSIHPLFSSDTNAFIYAIAALVLGVIAPFFYFLEDLFDINEIIGKFIAGISISVFFVMILNIYMTYNFDKPLPQIILSGILGFVTSLFLVRGVLVHAYGGHSEPETTTGWSFGEEDSAGSSESDDYYESSTMSEAQGERDFESSERFPEEEDEEPW